MKRFLFAAALISCGGQAPVPSPAPATTSSAAPAPASQPAPAIPAKPRPPRPLHEAEKRHVEELLGGDADWDRSRAVQLAQDVPLCSFVVMKDGDAGGVVRVCDRAHTKLGRASSSASYTPFEAPSLHFADLDGDGRLEVIVFEDMMTGIGPTGAKPFPVATIHRLEGTTLVVDEKASEQATSAGAKHVDDVRKALAKP